MTVFESLVKECMEEASIEADIVRKHTRAAGSISYFFRCGVSHLEINPQLIAVLLELPKVGYNQRSSEL
jgi:hypothetical protein